MLTCNCNLFWGRERHSLEKGLKSELWPQLTQFFWPWDTDMKRSHKKPN